MRRREVWRDAVPPSPFPFVPRCERRALATRHKRVIWGRPGARWASPPTPQKAKQEGSIMPTIYRILIGCGLITAVALISDRSRTLAGILGTAPINIPIVLWIIWSK